MGADANPGDSSSTADYKRRTPREIDRVDAHCLVDPIRARHRSIFVEKNREWIGVLFDMLLSLREPVDLLRGDECDGRVTFGEFLISRLELSQLVCTVRSPGAADEDQHQRLSTIIGKAHDFAIGSGKLEVRCRVADLQRTRGCFQHCYNLNLSAFIL
jgi:hypothetical protein